MTTTVKLGTSVDQTFTYWTDLSGISTGIPSECGDRTYTVTGGGPFLTLTETSQFNDPFLLSLMTDDNAHIGVYTITITVTLKDYPLITAATTTFTATVNPCVILSMPLTGGNINESTPTFTYRIGGP